MPKICLCFFGLTRSLKYTINNIENKIFKPLKNAGISYDIYLHTYDLEILNLKRSKEYNIMLDKEEYKLLKSDYVKITNQQKFLDEFPKQKVYKMGDPWHSGFQNVDNLLCQLNSLKQVTKMWQPNSKKYCGCLYIRPDLIYYQSLPKIIIHNIKNGLIGKNKIYLSRFYNYGGLNDRFAFGDTMAMRHYGLRLDNVLTYCQTKWLHAEKFLKYVISNYYINIVLLPFVLIRTRANGHKVARDLNIISKVRHLLPKKRPNTRPRPKKRPNLRPRPKPIPKPQRILKS